MPDDNVFEIGLVMAGAISAGAYTAGVMDFLIEALDAFEAAKKAPDWDGPTHDVRVPVMAGASAGGMTAAMSAVHAFHEMRHVEPAAPPPAPELNRLYSNWVRRIDLKELLKTEDLDGTNADLGVRSALCCKILDEILHETFALSGNATPRAWLGRGADYSVRVLVTLTNLRGVPYSFEVFGSAERPYAMLNHGDYLDFKIGVAPNAERGSLSLDISETSGRDWELFRTAALATGAFPVGLAPRTLTRPSTDYDSSLRVGRDTPKGFEAFKPDVLLKEVDLFDFIAVDGGTIDNEPLEMTRRLLGVGDESEADGRKAIVLVAPFPSFIKKLDDDVSSKIVDVVPRLSAALIQQSRFKADELAKALDEKVFTRFLISPERASNGNEESEKYPIASGVLGGFGGFIDESFRRHDFLLGRRNAQAFLRFHFALPADRPLFGGVKNREKWFVLKPKSDDSAPEAVKTIEAPAKASPKDPSLPIIPLCNGLDKEIVIGPDDLPKPKLIDQAALGALLEKRVGKVVEVLVDNDLTSMMDDTWSGGMLRWCAKRYLTQVATRKSKDMLANAIEEVKSAFL